jgi:hypothetical protein
MGILALPGYSEPAGWCCGEGLDHGEMFLALPPQHSLTRIQIWGEAYAVKDTSFSSYDASNLYPGKSHVGLAAEQDIMMKSFATSYSMMQNVVTNTSLTASNVTNLPSATDHPLFYVGVYALIGFFSAFVSLTSSAIQYTAALRASRILFK